MPALRSPAIKPTVLFVQVLNTSVHLPPLYCSTIYPSAELFFAQPIISSDDVAEIFLKDVTFETLELSAVLAASLT